MAERRAEEIQRGVSLVGPHRDDIVLATKVYQPMGLGPNDRRLSAYHIRRACEASLKALDTDRIDLYQYHRPDPTVPYAETIGAFKELQDEGKIRHIGVCNVTLEQLGVARSIVDVVSVQNRFNLTDRAAEDVLEACEAYYARRRRKVFIEYVMLGGVNDTYEQARALTRLLDPRIYKVNLIPYNPTGMYEGSSRDAIAAFKHVLERARLPATVRLTRGRDIAAACGQLRHEHREPRQSATSRPCA